MLMRMKQNSNSVHLLHLENKWAVAGTDMQWLGFVIFRERERVPSL